MCVPSGLALKSRLQCHDSNLATLFNSQQPPPVTLFAPGQNMTLPNQAGGAHLAPPSHSRQSSRSAAHHITIEPTDEYQRFYNSNRRELDRHRLELHVAEENNLELPRSQPMSRSTTSESIPSPSTVHSHAGDTDSLFSPEPTAEVARQRPPRGKRHGPLDLETRVKTAFKRKFKLTCEYHRKKRTSVSLPFRDH